MRVFIFLLVIFVYGCSTAPTKLSEDPQYLEKESLRERCSEAVSYSGRSKETSSAIYLYDTRSFEYNMNSLESAAEKPSPHYNNWSLETVESLYRDFIESDRRLQAELGECYPRLSSHYKEIKSAIHRYENMPVKVRTLFESKRAKEHAFEERNKIVESYLAQNIQPFKNDNVEVSVVQVGGSSAVLKIKAVGNLIVRYKIESFGQDQITGEAYSLPMGFSLEDDHGNIYSLKETAAESSLIGFKYGNRRLLGGTKVRPGQEAKVKAWFSDTPVESSVLTLRVTRDLIGSEISFKIPTEVWLLKPRIE